MYEWQCSLIWQIIILVNFCKIIVIYVVMLWYSYGKQQTTAYTIYNFVHMTFMHSYKIGVFRTAGKVLFHILSLALSLLSLETNTFKSKLCYYLKRFTCSNIEITHHVPHYCPLLQLLLLASDQYNTSGFSSCLFKTPIPIKPSLLWLVNHLHIHKKNIYNAREECKTDFSTVTEFQSNSWQHPEELSH